MSALRSRCWARCSILALLFVSGCLDREDEKACSFQHRLEVSVENSAGEPASLTEVSFVQGAERANCPIVSTGFAVCSVNRPGPVTVNALTNGASLSQVVDIMEGPSCSLQGGPLVLVDERPVCLASRLTAIEAELFWSEDVPVAEDERALVVATVDRRFDIACERQGNKFSCPPEAGAYGRWSQPFFDDHRVYHVRAILGSSTIEQDVQVRVDACQVTEPARVRLVHSEVPCAGTTVPALDVYVLEAEAMFDLDKRYNFLPADAVRILDADGKASPCTLESARPGSLGAPFVCSTATPAGGVYTVEINHGGGIERVLVQVRDDGCAPVRSLLALTFVPGQICDNDTRCGPRGEPLRSFSLCPNLPKEELPAICH